MAAQFRHTLETKQNKYLPIGIEPFNSPRLAGLNNVVKRMKLVISKSEYLDDWYYIENAEHDGRTWWEQTGVASYTFRSSARISDAEIEGTSAEMLALADAIMGEAACSFKRCAVACPDGYAYLWSPRNSQDPAKVPMEDARDLAERIYNTLGAKINEHD